MGAGNRLQWCARFTDHSLSNLSRYGHTERATVNSLLAAVAQRHMAGQRRSISSFCRAGVRLFR
jgi:hypothetical protein